MTECPRSIEAEAVRDDRLRGEGRRSFERHAANCAACRAEMRALEGLARTLKQASVPEIDQLRKLRGRRQLLRAEPVIAARKPRWALALAFAALAVCVLVMLRRPHAPPVAVTPPTFASIEGKPGARFERIRAGTSETIDLHQGELSIVVRHPTGGEHVLVKLPDGEIEDVGTVFTVRVDGDATRRVEVVEGAVVLRLHGQAPIHMSAGTSWDRPAPPVIVAPTAVPSAVPIVVAKPVPVVDSAALDWKTAMAAHRNGEYRVAAAKFAVFLSAHPSDAHAEDAAYLRVIALQRASDGPAMRSAAKDYLARYPSGFRRSEVERIAGD